MNSLLTPSHHLPLYGKRIIITAPRNYANRLCLEIINMGGLPILMPTIDTSFLDDYTELDLALRNLEQFDWIAFTSRNGIDAFFQRMFDLDIPTFVLDKCQLCAIGKDADRLIELWGQVDLSPDEPSPQGIVTELSRLPNIQGKKILVPVPVVVGIPEPNVVPNFISGLSQLGMEVTKVPAYTTRCLDSDIYEVELNLIRQGKIDAIAFSSTGEVESFLRMVDGNNDLGDCAIACFGPYTAANARDLGLNVSICSLDFSSFAGFVQAIAKRVGSGEWGRMGSGEWGVGNGVKL